MENILKQYKDLQCEKKDLEQRINRMQEELRSIEQQDTIHEKVLGGQGGKQYFQTEGVPLRKYKDKKTQLLLRQLRLKTLNRQINIIIEQVEQYINEIEDSRKRQILRYKYIDGLSWQHIAKKMGPGNSGDAIRMEVKRFFKKSSK